MPTKDEMGNGMEKILWFCLKRYFGGQTWVAPFPPSGSVGDGGVVDSEPKENDKFGMFSLLMIPGTAEDPPEDSGIPPGPPPAVADPA